jgi:hypothetical protein
VFEIVENKVQYRVRLPLIYLDHCSLRNIASHAGRRRAFVRILETKGTLLFSWMNAMETAPNSGQSVEDLRSLLDAVGPNWLLLENNFDTVAEREARGTPPPQVFFDEEYFRAWWASIDAGDRGPFRLGTMLNLAEVPEFKAMWQRRLQSLARVVSLLEEARRRMRAGTYRPRIRRDPSRPSHTTYDTLVAALLKDGKNIVVNDVCDLLHAAVSLTYAQWVVLDGAWANYGRQLRRERHVRLFPVNKLDEALASLERLRVVTAD